MQDVEEERFEEFRVLTHALEVEALKPGERNGVLGVVEEESELAASGPFGEAARNVVTERVRQHAQRAQRRVYRIQVFDLVEEIALGGRVEIARLLSLNQYLQEEREKIEVFLGWWQRKRVDLEILGFKADADIRAAEKLCEAFKAPAQVEDERVRIVFLEIGDEEIQQERFSSASSPKNHGVGHIAVVEIQEVRGVVVGFEDR